MLNARIKGTLTPEVQQNSETLAKKLNEKYEWNISGGAGMRELANYGRSIDLPIGGDGKGYYYAYTSREMALVEADITSRMTKMGLALAGVKRCRRRMQQIEAKLAIEQIKPTPSEMQRRMELYLGERGKEGDENDKAPGDGGAEGAVGNGG
jgi:hypothetical protein